MATLSLRSLLDKLSFKDEEEARREAQLKIADAKLGIGRSQTYRAEPQIAQSFKQGWENLSSAYRKDPGEFWYRLSPFSMKEAAVPASKVIGQAVGQPQLGEDVGYGLRGALSITPMQDFGLRGDEDKFQAVTPRQQTAERTGRFLYGQALAAPLGAGSLVKNIATRSLYGGGLGVGMTTGGTLLTEGRLPSKEELVEGGISGVENSWVLAFTGLGLDVALGKAATKVPSLLRFTSQGVGKPFADMANLTGQAKMEFFKEGSKRLMARAMLEVLPENTVFTFLDKLSGKEQEDFVDAWVRNLPGTIGTNIIFAGLQIGKGRVYDWNRNEIDAGIRAAKNALAEINYKATEVAPVGLTVKEAGPNDIEGILKERLADIQTKMDQDTGDLKQTFKKYFDQNYTDKKIYDQWIFKGWTPEQVMKQANLVDVQMRDYPGSVDKPEGLTYFLLRRDFPIKEKGGITDEYRPPPAELKLSDLSAKKIEAAGTAVKIRDTAEEMAPVREPEPAVAIKQPKPEPVVRIKPEEPKAEDMVTVKTPRKVKVIGDPTDTNRKIKDIPKIFAKKGEVQGKQAEYEMDSAKKYLLGIRDDLIAYRKKLGISTKRAFEIAETPANELTSKTELEWKRIIGDWNTITRAFRENPQIGLQEDYMPRFHKDMTEDLVEIPGLGWIDSFDLGLSTSLTRTGKLKDYMKDFDLVQERYVNQIVLDKYGTAVADKLGDYKRASAILERIPQRTSTAEIKRDMAQIEELIKYPGVDNKMAEKVKNIRKYVDGLGETIKTEQANELSRFLDNDVRGVLENLIGRAEIARKNEIFSKSIKENLKGQELGQDPETGGFEYYAPPNNRFDYIGESGKRYQRKAPIELSRWYTEGFNDMIIQAENKNYTEVAESMRQLRDALSANSLRAEKYKEMKWKDAEDALFKLVGTETQTRENFAGYIEHIKRRGLTNEEVIDYVMGRVRMIKVQNLVDVLGKYEIYGNGKNYLNKFIDYEFKLGHLKQTFLDKFVRWTSMAHLFWNPKVAGQQKLETFRTPLLNDTSLPMGTFLKETLKVRADAKKNGIDLNKKYAFDPDEQTKMFDRWVGAREKVITVKPDDMQKQVMEERRLQRLRGGGPVDKLRDIGFKPIAFVENSKNADMLAALEVIAKQKGFTKKDMEVDGKGWRWVRTQALRVGFIANKYNSPEMLQFNSAVNALMQYSRYGLMELNLAKDYFKQGDYTRLGGLALSRAVSTAIMAGLTGYGFKSVAEFLDRTYGQAIGFGPIVQVAWRTGEEIGDAFEERKKNGEMDQLTTDLAKIFIEASVRNLVPFGTQGWKTGEVVGDMQRGYGLSTTGKSITYPAPQTAHSAALGLLFGKSATLESRAFFGKQDTPYIWGEDKRGIEQMTPQDVSAYLIERRAREMNDAAVKDNLKKTGGSAISGNMYYAHDPITGDIEEYDLRKFSVEKEGIQKFQLEKEKYATARKMYADEYLSDENKEAAFKELGLDPEDVAYDYEANLTAEVTANYLYENLKDEEHDKIISTLLSGRIESISGKMLVDNTTVNELVERGLITYEEGKWLKKQKFNKNGEKIDTGEGTGKKKKQPTIKFKVKAPGKIPAVKIAEGGGGTTKIKIPKAPDIKAPSLDKLMKVYTPESKVRISTEELTPPKLTVKF